MPAAKHCPNCHAEVSPFAPSCPGCKTSLSGRAPLARTPKATSTSARPDAARSAGSASVTMAPAERRSLAIGQMSLQAGAIALWSGVFREANPNLTAWVRILNLISLLVLALVFFVGLIARI